MMSSAEKQAELRRFRRDVTYYEAHREELLKQYPEQWVAFFNEQVVGADPDYERLLDEVEGKGILGGRGVHRTPYRERCLRSSPRVLPL